MNLRRFVLSLRDQKWPNFDLGRDVVPTSAWASKLALGRPRSAKIDL